MGLQTLNLVRSVDFVLGLPDVDPARLAVTGSSGGGGSHTHSAAAFTGTAINLAVAYVDVIVATKD